MSYLGAWPIDAVLTFPANTHAAATGAATDGDSAPTYRVYEATTTAPILTGTMTLHDDANTAGFYLASITLSAANGLEVGKAYTIYVSATVGGVTGTLNHTFQVGGATGGPTATEIADALLKRDWTAVSGEAPRSVLNALRFLRNKWTTAGVPPTLTVTKEDDTTTAWTAALTTTAGAQGVSGVDPA
jgi:hypothetical protein